MRYTISFALLLLLSAPMLFAQKPTSKSSSNASATQSKPFPKNPVSAEEADRIPRHGGGGWTSDERVSFMNSCMAQVAWSRDSAFGYCSCVLQRVESRYPTASAAREIPQDTIVLWAKQCLSPSEKATVWKDADRKSFLGNCVQSFLKSPGTTKANATSYCGCMLQKIETAYPNPLDASGMGTEKVRAWAKDCLK